jgi:hypothetical protein
VQAACADGVPEQDFLRFANEWHCFWFRSP